jgi:hypothetical protein
MGLKVILHVIDSLFIGHSAFGVERSKDVSGLEFLPIIDALEIDLSSLYKVMQM